MAEYRDVVRDYLRASRKMMDLDDMTPEQVEAVRDMAERVAFFFSEEREDPGG